MSLELRREGDVDARAEPGVRGSAALRVAEAPEGVSDEGKGHRSGIHNGCLALCVVVAGLCSGFRIG